MAVIAARQFRHEVVRPTLERIGLWSKAAENLLMGTAAQESGLHYLRQLGGGPALGLYQVEPATHADLWKSWLAYRPPLAARLTGLAAGLKPAAEQLVWNLAYATAVARLLYRRVAEPLPDAADVHGLARYWKRHYNTPLGRGTTAEFVHSYRLVEEDKS